MIIGFAGIPGSGKSYDAAKRIADNLRLGRDVYTNMDGLDNQECRRYLQDLTGMDDYDFGRKFHWLSKAEVFRFWEIAKPGSLIVLDEMHKHFNARNWQSKNNGALADWASTHRHYGYDVIAITQDMEKLEKQFRTLIEWTYVFRKVNFLGSAAKNKYMIYAYDGCEHKGKALNTKVRSYEQKYFRIYKSYAGDAKEIGFMKHVNVLKHPLIFAVPVIIAVFIYLAFFKSSIGTGDLFGAKAHAKNIAAVQQKLKGGNNAQSFIQPVTGHDTGVIPQGSVSAQIDNQTWAKYKIQGYVTMGLKRWLYIGNTKLRGRDPDVRNIDYAAMTAECRIDRCGDPGGKVAIVERQQTASEPPDKPAPMEGVSKTELIKTKVPNDQLPN